MMWERIAGDLCSSAIAWGPGLLIAIVMLFGLYRLIREGVSALMLQAKSMDRMTSSIEQFVARDQSEHREIIILLKVIAGRLDRFEGKTNGD